MSRATVIIKGPADRSLIAKWAQNVAEGTIVEFKSARRSPDQNALMWAGPLRDIEQQGYLGGRTFRADVWHEYFKREYLPEEFDPEQCKEGYRKWDHTPKGERVLVGSTTDLTVRGFARYLKQVEAYAQVELGVQLHASPRQAA